MFRFHLIDESNARAILSWGYEPPYDFYNDSEEDANLLQHLLHPQDSFYSILDENSELIAYCSFGQDGQVTNGDYCDRALDIGMGIRPDLTGLGKGVEYTSAVLEFTDNLFKPKAFRVTLVAFNQPALRDRKNRNLSISSRLSERVMECSLLCWCEQITVAAIAKGTLPHNSELP